MWRDILIWAAETNAVFSKEWRSELRTRYALSTIGLFAFTTLVVVSIALGPVGTSESARPFVPVLLWLILLFAASAGLPRTFVHEEESGTAIALRLSAHPTCLFCGKALYNLSLLLLLEILVTPLFLGMLQMPVPAPGRLALALLVGGFGLAVGSTFTAAIVAQAQARGPLFAVLAFPVLLPLLKFAVDATLGASSTDPLLVEQGALALRMALLYNASLTVASLMLFPPIWNP
jgi:heme exporter protein B